MWRYILAALILALSQPAFADAFADYRAVQIALASANVTDDTVAKARKLFPDKIAFVEKVDAAARTNRNDFIANRQVAQAAYRDFIMLPAHPDVLHGYIAMQLGKLEKISAGERPGMVMAWGWSPLNTAAVIGYEATGEPRFIEQALQISKVAYRNIDDALGITENFSREKVRGWSFNHFDKTGREHTLAGLIVAPMLRLAVAARGKEIPAEMSVEIQKNADAGVEIIRSYLQYQVKDGDRRYFTYVFTGEEDAYNHIAAYALAAAYAYKLTGDSEFRDFCDGFLRYLVSHVTVGENGAYAWDYQNTDHKRHRSPLWKEAVTLSSIAYMSEMGIDVPGADRKGFVRGFTTYIAKPNRTVHARMGVDYFPLTGYNLMLSDYSHVQFFGYSCVEVGLVP